MLLSVLLMPFLHHCFYDRMCHLMAVLWASGLAIQTHAGTNTQTNRLLLRTLSSLQQQHCVTAVVWSFTSSRRPTGGRTRPTRPRQGPVQGPQVAGPQVAGPSGAPFTVWSGSPETSSCSEQVHVRNKRVQPEQQRPFVPEHAGPCTDTLGPQRGALSVMVHNSAFYYTMIQLRYFCFAYSHLSQQPN